MLLATQNFVPAEQKLHVMIAGISGIITYLAIDGFTHYLENMKKCGLQAVRQKCRLHRVDKLSLFGINRCIILFRRSTRRICVKQGHYNYFNRTCHRCNVCTFFNNYARWKKTLKQFLYLEHGAHWAIGALACLMLVSTVKEIPEAVTGGIGLGFIVLAFISSVMHNKKWKDFSWKGKQKCLSFRLLHLL